MFSDLNWPTVEKKEKSVVRIIKVDTEPWSAALTISSNNIVFACCLLYFHLQKSICDSRNSLCHENLWRDN